MKVITIAGNVGKNSETRQTQSGNLVTSFSVAVSEGRDKPTTWFDVDIWGRRGEKVAQYIKKGSQITVAGRFDTREHEGRTYLKIVAHDFALQGQPRSQSSNTSQDRSPQDVERDMNQRFDGAERMPDRQSYDLDDEVPF